MTASKIKTAPVQIASYQTALELYHLDLGRYPETSAGLAALAKAPAGAAGWAGPYLDKSLANDPWGNPYDYAARADGTGYKLRSFGADGKKVGWATMPTSAHDDAGFTLAEMLLVVAITAMAAGLVVGRGLPGQPRIDKAALQSFVRAVPCRAVPCRAVRADAMRDDRIVSLAAAVDGHGFVAGDKKLDLPPGHLANSVNTAGGLAISFGPDGSSDGGLLRVRTLGAEDWLVVAPVTEALQP